MIQELNLHGSPCDDPQKGIIRVPIDRRDSSNNNTKCIVYNRTLLFPLTRWIQMNRNKKVTHKKLDEFRELSLKVRGNWIEYHSNSDEFDGNQSDGFYQMIDSVKWAMLHIWDMRGELRPWLAKDMCKVLVGTIDPMSLPNINPDAYNREREFRGGMNSMEMAMSNIETAIFGGERQYDSEDMEEAQETSQGQIKYEHDLEPYLNSP